MKKKIIGLLLAIAQLLALCVIPAYALGETAEVVFDKTITSTGFENMQMQRYTSVERDDKKGIQLEGKDGSLYIMFKFDKNVFGESTDPQPMKMTVEYFDEGKGHFGMSYFGASELNRNVDNYSDSGIIKLEDTKKWKTADILVDDMLLGQWSNGLDCRFCLWNVLHKFSAAPVIIRSIKFEKVFPTVPIKVDAVSEYTGNMFDINEEKVFNFELENITDIDGKAKVSYYSVDNTGKKLCEGEFETEVDAREKKTETVKLENADDKYGLYGIHIKTDSTFEGIEENYVSEKVEKYSIFDKFDEKDTRSKDYFVATHSTGYTEKTQEKANALAWAGFAGPRDSPLNWRTVEVAKGVMEPDEVGIKYLEQCKELGLKMIIRPGYNNPLYEPDIPFKFGIIPHTRETSEAYGNYAVWLYKNWGDAIDSIEVWNEPNSASTIAGGGFNYYGVDSPKGDGSVYAGFQNVVYETIKKQCDVPVVGISAAEGQDWYFKQVFDNGGLDSMDEISDHPYQWSEHFDLEKFINKYVKLKDMMKEYGRDVPITLTELGMSSADANYSTRDERMQACYGIEAYITGKGEELIYKMTYYNLCEKGDRPDNREDNFGMIGYEKAETPFAAKPLYIACVGVNRMLSTAEPTGKIKKDANIYCYNFKRADGQNVVAMWACKQDESISLDLGTSTAKMYDLYTNEVATLSSNDGIFNIKLTEEPIYLMGNFTKFEEASTAGISAGANEIEAVAGDIFTVDYTSADGGNYDVEVEAKGQVSVVENNGIKNGKGTLSLKLADTAQGRQEIYVKALADGAVKYMDKLVVEAVKPIELSMETSQVSKYDSSRWQANITIMNKSYTNSISGKVTLVSPKEALPYANTPEFSILRPRESVTLHINLDPMLEKRVREMSLKVELDSGYTETITETVDFTSARYTSKKPTIDGEISAGEWIGTWITADEEVNASTSKYANWTKENCSVDANMMWDEENLYFSAIVTDDTFYNAETDPQRLWAGDSIQMGFEDKLDSNEAFMYGDQVSGMTEIGIGLIAGKPVFWRYNSLYGKESGLVENCEIAIKRVGNETIYEAILPWSEIYEENHPPRTKMRFSMLVNDHDGESRNWIEYTGGIATKKDALLFGKMTLYK